MSQVLQLPSIVASVENTVDWYLKLASGHSGLDFDMYLQYKGKASACVEVLSNLLLDADISASKNPDVLRLESKIESLKF